MEEWDIQLMEKTFQNSIDLLKYKRYKDDTNVLDKTRTTEEGVVISDQSMMARLKIMADSIDPKFESNN